MCAVGQEPVQKVCLPFVGVVWKYESELQLQRQLFFINNLNGIKKHVEDISVDAELGCEFCSVLVIYDANYNINNYIILSTVSSPITTITVTILSSPYHHYYSNYSKLPLSPLSQLLY